MSNFGPWYATVKKIKGRRYHYDQTTRRVGARIETRNRYIGPVGGRPIRLSYAGQGGGMRGGEGQRNPADPVTTIAGGVPKGPAHRGSERK